ncbi:transmembrane protein 42-like [Oscarella lobularis]|uniref:transmembrane protein 42-like n=1 Tax=Oscarella lobularis TaxID=121494 RepID=UPI003313B667
MLLVVLAGFWGTIAASCAKFVIATSNAFPHRFACWILTGTALNDECHGWALSVSQWFWLFMVVAANVLQWISFMQGVHRCSSTSEAVVVCNCSGFFFTAAIGYALFGEPLSLLWGLGASVIVCGLAVLQKSGKTDEKTKVQ